LSEYKNTVRIFEAEKGRHHKNTKAEPKNTILIKKTCIGSIPAAQKRKYQLI